MFYIYVYRITFEENKHNRFKKHFYCLMLVNDTVYIYLKWGNIENEQILLNTLNSQCIKSVTIKMKYQI